MGRELVDIILPVLLPSLLGWAWGRSGRRFDMETASELVVTVSSPCLIFSRLVGMEVERWALSQMAVLTLIAVAALSVSGALLLRLFRLPIPAFLGCVVFTNSGNMAVPLSLFAFGPRGEALAVVYFGTSFLVHSLLGAPLVSGEWSARPMLRSPIAWAALASVGVLASGLHLPLFVVRTTKLIGDIAVPLMLIMMGVSLSKLPVRSVRNALPVSFLRIGLGTGLGFVLAELLHLEGTVRGVLVLQCAMPAAVLNYVFAERYQRAPEDVAGTVLVSTVLSFATLPLLLPVLAR